jgi:protein-tyrosine phosphatase
MKDRIKSFEKIFNFRDFGGYENKMGKMVKANKLFRSAHFNNATETDQKILADFDVGLIVDLRHKTERDRQPTNWPATQSPQRLLYNSINKDNHAAIAPHEAFMKDELHTPKDARDYMIRSYGQRPLDLGFKKIFGDTLRYMANSGKPVLVHCAAGKDRTGSLCSIILGCLGVDKAIQMSDYMLTMKAVDIDSYLLPAAKMFTARYGREIDPEAIRPMFGVEEAYLESSFDTIINMNEYIREELDVSEEEISAIKEAYLE